MREGHGDDLFRYKGKVKSNFSSNIFSGFRHDNLLVHIGGLDRCLYNYPEPEPTSLESDIASFIGTERSNVLATSGATDAIYLAAQSRRGSRSDIVVPTFREYQDACRIHCHKIRFIAGIRDISEDADCVWLCNPDNPTGRITDKNILLEAVRSRPSTLFMIDQAYADYTRLPVLTAEEAAGCGNVILLGSLTKRFSVPGLRVGYMTGAAPLLAPLRELRMPWSLGQIAIEGARYLISRADRYPIDADTLHNEAQRLADAFREMGIEVGDTDCNFILCRLPVSTAAELKEYLVEKHGILIRDASNFETLTPRHFRVAAQTREENDNLINAIKEWIISLQ